MKLKRYNRSLTGWTGRVGEQEEKEEIDWVIKFKQITYKQANHAGD